ncbi:MAG: 3-deoxy-manno-octulosonate cytidylyltransferase [Vicinamibacterales bacterium]
MPVAFPAGLARSLRSARTVGIIPARYQSTRLPGKPLALIAGRPMIAHVCARAAAAASLDAVLVATDDDRVAAAVDEAGFTAVMTRADHPSGTDRLAEVADALTCDVVVNIQGDEPLLAGEAIDAAVAPLLSPASDEVMTTLRRRLDDPDALARPDLVKVVVARSGHALYFSRLPVPFARPGAPAPVHWHHIGLYAYRRATLLALAGLPPTPLEAAEGLEQLRALEHGIRILTVETTAEAVGVDTPDDLERVRRRFEAAPTRG